MMLNKFSPGSRRESARGLSAVDFLIGIAVLGLIILLTVPGSSALFQRQNLNDTLGDLASSLTLAQSEAEKRHGTVRLCPSSDGTTCDENGDWDNGWLVYSDGNGDRIPQSIERIRAYERPAKKIHIIASGALADSPAFTIAGLTSAHQLQTGEFEVCSIASNSGARRKIVVNLDGETRMIKYDGKNCGK